ncbi:hypothetical protein CPB85DRAFT_1314396 [Mucidula mucida]|nr:hypothetical protein CPB85DRAFT_1314396 [Mucidula mucida]
MCVQVTQDTGTFYSSSFTPLLVFKYTEHDALRLPLATIPNIDALSPTAKRKHDVNAAEACLSGKEGGGEASLETETPAKRLKPAGSSRAKSLKQTGKKASTYHVHQVRPARVGKDGSPHKNFEKANAKSAASTSKLSTSLSSSSKPAEPR